MLKKKIIAIQLLLILTISIFSGCVDETTTTDTNTTNDTIQYSINTNYPRDHLGLNTQAEAAFTAACNRYSELESTLTDEEARTTLVNELNNDFAFIKKAKLSEDGYTIPVVFEDDTAALIITYQPTPSENEPIVTGPQFNIYTPNTPANTESTTQSKTTTIKIQETPLTPLASEIEPPNTCNIDFIVPQSKKVLIINAASLCEPYWSNYEERNIINSFHQNNWALDDIDIKKRSSLNDGNLTPDDYFNYSDYGMVMYIGHGGYCSGYEGSIPGHHYLECSDIKANYTSIVGKQRLEQYRTWRDQGRLIYGAYYTNIAETEWEWELYIDTDLIKEQAKIDPGTIIYMTSCNSNRAADTYLTNDAGCFFGFDYKTDGNSSAEAFNHLINAMTNHGAPQNAAYALNQLSDDVRTTDAGGKLQIYDNGKDVYLPAFGTIVVQPDSPPSGTSYYELEFSPYGTTEEVKINAGEEIEYDGVSPVNTTITIRAKSSAGNTIETSIFTPLLQSGENELLTITSWNVYGIILEADPIAVKDDGKETTTITATLKRWQDTDVLEPTGEPLVCKEVEFISSLGTFVESEKAYTDRYGRATVELSSDKEGIATIRAVVEGDAVESYKTVEVTFGDLPYRFSLVSHIGEQASGWNGQNTVVVYSWRYWLVFQGSPDVDRYKITIHLNGYPLNEESDHKEYITQGIIRPTVANGWLTAQEEEENWTEDFNEGYRFFEISGLDHYGYEAGVTDVRTMQNEYYSKITKWTFEIEPYTG